MDTYTRNSGAVSSSPAFLTLMITFVLGLAIGFFCCYAWLSPRLVEPEKLPAPVAVAPAPAPVEASLEGLLAEVRPGRHLFLGVDGKDLSPEYAELLGHIHPGGIVLRPENVESPEQASRLVVQLKKALGGGTGATDPPLIVGDPDVLAMGLPGSFPELVAARDAGRAFEAGRAVAAAFQTYGIRVAFGPSLAPVAGSDLDVVSAVGLAYADGLAQGGVLPVVKGYPGNAQDGMVGSLSQDVTGLATLFLPFTEALGRGVPGIRIEPVAVPALDVRFPERPASLSPVLVRRLLRGGAKPYEGVVIADDLASGALSAGYRPAGAAVEALSAGCDAVVYLDTDPERIRAVCAAIAAAVQEGVLARERLDESKIRLDGWQAWVREPKALEGPLPEVLAGAPLGEQTPTAPEAVGETVDGNDGKNGNDVTNSVEPVAVPVAEQTPVAPVAVPVEAPAPVVEAPKVEAEAPKAEEAPKVEAPKVEVKESGDVAPAGTERVVYTIQEGDRLFRIAKRFGVSADDIVKWNDLPDQNIKFGRTLIIYTPLADAPAESGAGLPAAPVAEAPAAAVEAVTPVAPQPEPQPIPEVTAPPAPEAVVEPPVVEPEAAAPEAPPGAPGVPVVSAGETDGFERIEHEVQRGEILSRIASQYGVKQSDIVKWNKLSNLNLQRGQRLILYVEPGMEKAESPAPEKAVPEAPAPEAEDSETPLPAAEAPTPPDAEPPSEETYVVQPGDTASRLARKYGVSVAELLRLNGIDDADRILVGQTIKVPRGK